MYIHVYHSRLKTLNEVCFSSEVEGKCIFVEFHFQLLRNCTQVYELLCVCVCVCVCVCGTRGCSPRFDLLY